MGDELANLLKIFKRVEKDGGQATLSVSTNAGKTTIKLELTSSPSQPAPSLPSSSASGGRRRRHRGPAKKEKAKVRAALHQATLHISLIVSSKGAIWGDDSVDLRFIVLHGELRSQQGALDVFCH